MEIAKFVLTAIGTFVSVSVLSFSVFQYWKKKQEERLEQLGASLKSKIQSETDSRKEEVSRLRNRVEKLETIVTQSFENRLSKIEGMLSGMGRTLDKIQDWFINNPPRGNG